MSICIICCFWSTWILYEGKFSISTGWDESNWKLFWQFVIEFPLHNLPNLSFPSARLSLVCAPLPCNDVCSSVPFRRFTKIHSHPCQLVPPIRLPFLHSMKMPLDSHFVKIKLRLSSHIRCSLRAFKWKVHFGWIEDEISFGTIMVWWQRWPNLDIRIGAGNETGHFGVVKV